MHRSNPYFLCVIFVLTLSLWAWKARASEPFDPHATNWEGCSKFIEFARDELSAERVIVAAELDYEKLSFSDGIVLIHPLGTYDIDELATFLRLGGRVAVIDDFGDGNRLLERFRITRTPAPVDPLQMLRGNPQLPIAKSASKHPIVNNVTQIALNHPTTLQHPELSPLLQISRAGGQTGPDVAIAGQVGEGRLVALGDPSIFINSMMRYPGNRTLAQNLVAYLLEPRKNASPTPKLYILHGKFREKGSLSKGVHGSLRDRMRGLFAAIDDVHREGFSKTASRIVAMAIAIAAMVWVLARAVFRVVVPKPRYAQVSNPVSYAIERDVRIVPFYSERKHSWRKIFQRLKRSPNDSISAAGVYSLWHAFESAIASSKTNADHSKQALTEWAQIMNLSSSETHRLYVLYTHVTRFVTNKSIHSNTTWNLTLNDTKLLSRFFETVALRVRQ